MCNEGAEDSGAMSPDGKGTETARIEASPGNLPEDMRVRLLGRYERRLHDGGRTL